MKKRHGYCFLFEKLLFIFSHIDISKEKKHNKISMF